MSNTLARLLAFTMPMLTVLPLALVAGMPWGASTEVEFALPLVTLGGIFYWAVRRPRQMPVVFVFLMGLFTDLATVGPLGYWPLVYLVGYGVGLRAPRLVEGHQDGPATMLLFALAAGLVTVLGWAISSLYFLQVMAPRPLILGCLGAIAVYPVFGAIVAPIDGFIERQESIAQVLEEG